MKPIYLISTLVMAFMASTNASAGHRDHHRSSWARVVNVQPVYESVRVRSPQRHCWTETVASGHSRHRGEIAGTLAGGVIGGAIGHSVGHSRKDRHTGAVIGTLVGMAIGNDLAHHKHNRHDRVSYRDVERCETRHSYQREQRFAGYEVSYRYHGKLYRTHTNRHPGKRIKVAVDVRPYRH